MKGLIYSAFVLVAAKVLNDFGVSAFISLPILYVIISMEPKPSDSVLDSSLPEHRSSPSAPSLKVVK